MSIKCAVCGKVMQKLTWAHLKTHNLDFESYFEQYGEPEQVPDNLPHPLDPELKESERTLLTDDQKSYILARAVGGKSRAAAMASIDRSISLLYSPGWSKIRPIAEAIVARLASEPLLRAQMRLVTGSEKAADRLVTLVDDKDPRVSLRASESVLSRTGLGPRVGVTLDLDFSRWSLEELDKAISRELAEIQAIEAQYTEVDDE